MAVVDHPTKGKERQSPQLVHMLRGTKVEMT
jgi:hypothetical protein